MTDLTESLNRDIRRYMDDLKKYTVEELYAACKTLSQYRDYGVQHHSVKDQYMLKNLLWAKENKINIDSFNIWYRLHMYDIDICKKLSKDNPFIILYISGYSKIDDLYIQLYKYIYDELRFDKLFKFVIASHSVYSAHFQQYIKIFGKQYEILWRVYIGRCIKLFEPGYSNMKNDSSILSFLFYYKYPEKLKGYLLNVYKSPIFDVNIFRIIYRFVY